MESTELYLKQQSLKFSVDELHHIFYTFSWVKEKMFYKWMNKFYLDPFSNYNQHDISEQYRFTLRNYL